MKYLVTIFVFCLSLSSSAQLLKSKPIELPLFLSLSKTSNFQNHFHNINDLKMPIEPYTFTINELDKMRSGNLYINTKNINKKAIFLNRSAINLKKELRNVMLKIPGEFGPVRARGFTL